MSSSEHKGFKRRVLSSFPIKEINIGEKSYEVINGFPQRKMKIDFDRMSQKEQELALQGVVALRKAAEALLSENYDSFDKLMAESDECYNKLSKK